MNENMITTSMSRRLWHKLISRLEAIKNDAAEDIEDYGDREEEYYKNRVKTAMNTIREIDLILEALYAED